MPSLRPTSDAPPRRLGFAVDAPRDVDLAVDARDVDLAVEPPRDGPDARVLLSLSDDSLHVIFANLPLPAVAAFAGVCKHTATLSCAENLWQRLMQARWPGVAPAEDGRWRVLHRERAMLPRWQYLWSCMDAIEQLLADRAPAWPAKFAGHLIRMGAGPVPHGAAAYDAWGERVRGALAPMALRELVRWLSQLSQGLDIYYDVQEQVHHVYTHYGYTYYGYNYCGVQEQVAAARCNARCNARRTRPSLPSARGRARRAARSIRHSPAPCSVRCVGCRGCGS